MNGPTEAFLWFAHWVCWLPALGAFTNLPPTASSTTTVGFSYSRPACYSLVPSLQLTSFCTCWLELESQVIKYCQKVCNNISPCTESTGIWRNLRETLARLAPWFTSQSLLKELKYISYEQLNSRPCSYCYQTGSLGLAASPLPSLLFWELCFTSLCL